MVRNILILSLALLIPLSANAQPASWIGRWVNTDSTDLNLLVLSIQDDGTAHRLMPAPQFGATYELNGDHVVMRAIDGSVDSNLVLRDDVLMVDERPVAARLGSPPSEPGSIAGTWRPMTRAGGPPMDMFWTFRSDGQMIIEVGVNVETMVSGDTLRLVSQQVPSQTLVISVEADTMYAKEGDLLRSLVQRPWGCLGISQLDLAAEECH